MRSVSQRLTWYLKLLRDSVRANSSWTTGFMALCVIPLLGNAFQLAPPSICSRSEATGANKSAPMGIYQVSVTFSALSLITVIGRRCHFVPELLWICSHQNIVAELCSDSCVTNFWKIYEFFASPSRVLCFWKLWLWVILVGQQMVFGILEHFNWLILGQNAQIV